MLGVMYDNVKVGDPVVRTLPNGFDEGVELVSATYAYLEPSSPMHLQAAVLTRLKLLMDARFQGYRVPGSAHLTDFSGSFGANFAYFMLKTHRPQDLTATEQAEWEDGMEKFCAKTVERDHLYDPDQPVLLGNFWMNADIRLALGLYCGGLTLGNQSYVTAAAHVMENFASRTVLEDGGTYYVGYGPESNTYHDASIEHLIWWWLMTDSPRAYQAVFKSKNWVPLSTEPRGFSEESTSIAYKHDYNGLVGQDAALAKGYLFGDQNNYYFGRNSEQVNRKAWSLLHAILYKPGLTVPVMPDQFVVRDRAIDGPRGRFGDWFFTGVGRAHDQQGAEHDWEDGVDPIQGAKNTFVGAGRLKSGSSGHPFGASFDAASVLFKFGDGVESDWFRGNRTRHNSMNERTSQVIRKGFATLATSYDISGKRFGAATVGSWPVTQWNGDQLWLMTGQRLVGLLQVHPDVQQTVYDTAARFTLCSGRRFVLGGDEALVSTGTNQWDFGELALKVHQSNFGGPVTTTRFEINRGDLVNPRADRDFAVSIELHDNALFDSTNSADRVTYPAGTRRYALMECGSQGAAFANVSNVTAAGTPFTVFEVPENNRSFRLVQNVTAQSQTYTAAVTTTYQTASLHRSWHDRVLPLPVAAGSAAVSVSIPAYSHVVVVAGNDAALHEGGEWVYEELFESRTDLPTTTAINVGGRARLHYTHDRNYSGGTVVETASAIDVSQLKGKSSPPVVQTARENPGTLEFLDLEPSTTYQIRLTFAEIGGKAAGQRRFHVLDHAGNSLLTGFDIGSEAGGANRAIEREFAVTSNATGVIQLQFQAVVDLPLVGAVELIAGGGVEDLDGNGLADDWERRYAFGAGWLDPGMDPDRDGLANRAEFFFGADPTKQDQFLSRLVAEDSTIAGELTLSHAEHPLAGMLYRKKLQVTSDLKVLPWADLNPSPAGTMMDNDGRQSRQYEILETSADRFFRLMVTPK